MTRRLASGRALVVTAVAFVAASGLFMALNDATETGPRASVDPAALARQGELELQRARETADPASSVRAEAAFDELLAVEPSNVDATIGLGTLALARHDFREALRLGQTARRLAPGLARPYTVLVDAQVELGEYAAAAVSLQEMIDLRPNLASYARVSYFRELQGDLDGAADAMSLAVAAGGQVAENVAYVQTLLGDLEATRGDVVAARVAYDTALGQVPGYVPARVSRARLDAAAGRIDEAIGAYEEVVRTRPQPEYVIALGESQLAAGLDDAARETFALVEAQRRLSAAEGVDTDVEVALFEAEHGDPVRGLDLGRRAWRAAPGVRSADALGWAHTQAGQPLEGLAWARRALRRGWSDPTVLTRAGLSARAAGDRPAARRYLRRALSRNPRFSVTWAPRARRALDEL